MLFTESRCFTSENEPEQLEWRVLSTARAAGCRDCYCSRRSRRGIAWAEAEPWSAEAPWLLMDGASSIVCSWSASVLWWLLNSDLFLIWVALGLKSRFESCQSQVWRGHRLPPKGCDGRAPETVVHAVRATCQSDTLWERTVGSDQRFI